MTISNEIVSVQVSGDGAQTTWDYNFLIPAQSYARLVLTDEDGIETDLPTTVWSITGIGSTTGGTFTYPRAGSGGAPAPSGTTLTLIREVPYAQLTNLRNQSAYYPQAVEGALDFIVMQVQQLRAMLRRTLRLGASFGNLNELRATVAERANKMLIFDSAGQPDVADIPGAGTSLTGDASLATVIAQGTTTARTLRERFADALHLRDFGAVGDGVTNDAAAIDAWIAAVLSTGKPGYFGVGHYKYVGTQFLMIIGGLAATQGGKLLGAGYARTILDVTACTGTPQFLVRCQANFLFGWTFDGFEVRGNREGVMAQWARDWDGSTYPDSFNSCRFTDLVFRNNGVTDNAIAVRFNSVLESEFHTVANCNNNAQLLGIATDLQGVGFSKGKITGGNARYAMRIARFTFGNEFNGELAVCQCPILLDCPSGWNKVGGNLGWGQPNANPALSGINGVGFAVEALVAGGPLYLARETIYGQAGAPLVTGAAKANVVALGYGQGTTVSQSLRLQPTSAADSPTILQLAAAGRAAETQYYRDGSPAALRWTLGMSAANAWQLNRYNASSVFQDTPFYVDASTGQFVVNRLLGLRSLRPPEYTVATLPPVSDRGIIMVTNESGGFVPAFSDGVNWRRVTDRNIVS